MKQHTLFDIKQSDPVYPLYLALTRARTLTYRIKSSKAELEEVEQCIAECLRDFGMDYEEVGGLNCFSSYMNYKVTDAKLFYKLKELLTSE